MNFELPDFDGKDVVFVGKGTEGFSFEKFINANANIKSFKFVDEKDDPNYLENLKNLDLSQTIVVKTPGCPGRKMTVPYTTATRVFFDCIKQNRAKSIGITGTKGKTTTASLMAHVLKEAGLDARLCGNMGHSMLDFVANSNENTIFVVELSSYQLAELEQSPDIAIITNIYHDHIDYHGNFETYVEAKRNIIRYMDVNGTLVFDPKYKTISAWVKDSKIRQLPIDINDDFDMSNTKLIGDHNKSNILLVKAVSELLGIDNFTVQSAIKTFEPVRHRLQPFRTVRNITFVDDAIGSTPEATVAGIKALVHNLGPVGCILLGGVDRGYDFKELAELLYRLNIPKLVLFPDTGPIIKELLPESYTPEILESRDMDEAVKWAADNTPSGSICLLSTAAPSTVLWKSFEEKGSLFQQAVNQL